MLLSMRSRALDVPARVRLLVRVPRGRGLRLHIEDEMPATFRTRSGWAISVLLLAVGVAVATVVPDRLVRGAAAIATTAVGLYLALGGVHVLMTDRSAALGMTLYGLALGLAVRLLGSIVRPGYAGGVAAVLVVADDI